MAKKLVIIGAGLSGLTAGIYARKMGYEVAIYEKHTIVGGECTGWDRKGYHIDNCIHWLMGCVPGSGLYDIWKTTDAISEDQVIQQEVMYVSEYQGQKVTLWKDIKRTEEELICLSPEDEAEIKDLMKYSRLAQKVEIPSDKPTELMNALDMIKLTIKQRVALKIFSHYRGMDTRELMAKFKHPLIRYMISDFVTPDGEASAFAMAYGNFTAGNGGVPKGGSRAMAFRMKARLEALGGKIFTGMPVEKILLGENHKAIGIRLENGKQIEADYVIAACDTAVTFGKLLDPKYMDPVLKEMYEKPEQYKLYSMFQAAYAVEASEDVIGHETIFSVDDLKTESWMGERITVKSFGYEPSFAPAGKQIVQVLWGGDVTAYDFFKTLSKDKEKYNAYKKALALKLMEKIEAHYPAYQGKMKLLDVWTPLTYERYCNAYKGYNQAFVKAKGANAMAYPSAYIKGLDNVILAGQWLVPPGGCPGAAIQGKFAAMRVQHVDQKKNRK